ncbi:MAG: type II toxin-antitoxin system PemK/MazF family toxin [Candidatus Anammoxibacter sp.]
MKKTNRFQVWLVSLNPTKGKEVNKTRPCVIISPNENGFFVNRYRCSDDKKRFDYPCRITCRFQNKKGLILLDQIRAVDKSRLVKFSGVLSNPEQKELCLHLQEMFEF